MRRWTRRDTSLGLSFGLEMVGCALLFSAASLPYRVLGGVLLAAGTVPWILPVVGDAIAKERDRDTRSTPAEDDGDVREARGRRTRDEADEAFGGMVARMDMPPHARAG